jgi:hypothetical protein
LLSFTLTSHPCRILVDRSGVAEGLVDAVISRDGAITSETAFTDSTSA